MCSFGEQNTGGPVSDLTEMPRLTGSVGVWHSSGAIPPGHRPGGEKGQVWQPRWALQPPHPQPGPEGPTNKKRWKRNTHCPPPPGWKRRCVGQILAADSRPRQRGLHTLQKTCKHSVQILLPFIVRGSCTVHTRTDSKDQRGRDTLSSQSDKVTPRGGPRRHHGALFRGGSGQPDLGPSCVN